MHFGTRTTVARDEDLERGHNSNADICMKAVDRKFMSSLFPVVVPQNSTIGQQRQQKSELQFDKFPIPSSFLVWKKFDSQRK